jgi:hypothetical protein
LCRMPQITPAWYQYIRLVKFLLMLCVCIFHTMRCDSHDMKCMPGMNFRIVMHPKSQMSQARRSAYRQ